ncbi:bifunctional phosphopantothenoylcysteine decarboxylase/phosphopantothenate--cysteine ligase CoaBC [Pseudomaricurvus sp. HS19]|uniref:bifunctional phosphopantothenoylcysteine decarboxylase/phosphopantothenate--cysteine ligase CoaBC n=1 Tax=Pseudomaricurvus sp. HS19 TaxID=2692626 RepID=UPI001369CF1A|nr:bifunctional phosphopantothenoylcysteine decarboxylase/phosphopantothenate--cysteine ligase CoaBC [Pseudomaricurvus sp. HS19]MYM63723.1 bifunctional phosphopantothenoylcysteine decarboxylase/phosphopantothenate--cysteine ligase CoaBC [Pseudomaricurvus sp. HS19]
MSSLTNKHILLGVTGGIAAYKSAELVRRLQDQGASVRVVMTPAAQEFITPLTLQALSGNPVHTTLLDPEAEMGMGHIELARWADLLLVAPASADFMARLAQGLGNDLLTTLCLATAAPICLAPAMNQGMWHSPATQENLQTLRSRGITLFGPAAGAQACGDVGPGRMLEPGELADLTAQQFSSGLLAGKKVVITAGPTREPIDPVRYISNHSSGKMGYAIAQAAVEAGARVTLISGPTRLPAPDDCRRIDVETAEEMLAASLAELEGCDLFIASAAVADFRPAQLAGQKIKKGSSDTMTLELVKNPDIVSTVASHAQRPAVVVGFAAETQDVVRYARDKLQRKNLDLVIANDVSRADIGFNSDDNAVTLVWRDREESLAQRSKAQLARDLIQHFTQTP